MAKKGEIRYQDALKEIEDILEKVETEELDVDDLAEKVKRASELLKICKKKLRNTEKDVDQVLEDMNNADNEEN